MTTMHPLPPLPYHDWRATKDTLHMYLQIVGKVRLALAPPRNHWWHVPFHLTARGLTTRPMILDGAPAEVRVDMVDHEVQVVSSTGRQDVIDLVDGLSVAEFHRRFMALIADFGSDVSIDARPFGMPMTTPFAEDTEHASYDRDAVRRFHTALLWIADAFEEFTGWFSGKTSPVHVFWHSFDLAVTRFSGRRAPEIAGADTVTREAYSHEVVSFGFWAGDQNVPTPTFYAYAAPEPKGLTERLLDPKGATWVPQGQGHLAVLPYETVREADDWRGTLLEFLESAYRAGATTAGWDVAELTSSFCPPRIAS
jgi:hypothetical protein